MIWWAAALLLIAAVYWIGDLMGEIVTALSIIAVLLKFL